MRTWWLLAGSAVVAGCLLVTDLDGLQADGDLADAAPATDRGEPAPPDAVSPPADGGSDATVDAPAIPFCQRTDATFCDDYERLTVLGDWTMLQQVPDASVSIVAAPGGGRELLGYSVGGEVGPLPAAYLQYTTGSSVTYLAWEANVRFDEFPTGARNIMQLVFKNQPTYSALLLSMNDANSGFAVLTQRRLADGGISTQPLGVAAKIGPGESRRVRMSVEQSGPGVDPRFVVSIDGQISVDTVLGTDELLGAIEVRQGINFAMPPATDWSVRYDDTTIDVRTAAP